jgi:hypothetical protein
MIDKINNINILCRISTFLDFRESEHMEKVLPIFMIIHKHLYPFQKKIANMIKPVIAIADCCAHCSTMLSIPVHRTNLFVRWFKNKMVYDLNRNLWFRFQVTPDDKAYCINDGNNFKILCVACYWAIFYSIES